MRHGTICFHKIKRSTYIPNKDQNTNAALVPSFGFVDHLNDPFKILGCSLLSGNVVLDFSYKEFNFKTVYRSKTLLTNLICVAID